MAFMLVKLNCLENVVDRSKTDHIILTTNGIALRKEGFLDRICSSAIDSVNLSYMHYDKSVNDTIFSNKTLSPCSYRDRGLFV